MDLKAIYQYCKSLGCCDLCCLRYMGVKCPKTYGSSKAFLSIYQDQKPKEELTAAEEMTEGDNKSSGDSDEAADTSGTADELAPPAKKRKLAKSVCNSCLGVLQEPGWQKSFNMVKEALDEKGYESSTFACALSAPIATMLREKAIVLRLEEQFPGYDNKNIPALKEAWKWSYGKKLSSHIKKTLDSGSVSPLLITVNMDYVDDLKELEILKSVSPQLFEERSKQKRRFATEFTRRSVEQALERATLALRRRRVRARARARRRQIYKTKPQLAAVAVDFGRKESVAVLRTGNHIRASGQVIQI